MEATSSRTVVRKWGTERSHCSMRRLATRQASEGELWVSRRMAAAFATPIQESKSRGGGERLSRRAWTASSDSCPLLVAAARKQLAARRAAVGSRERGFSPDE